MRGLVVSYTHFDAERVCYTTRVDFLPLDETVRSPDALRASAGDWRRVFETAPCLGLNPSFTAMDGIAAGGRVAFKALSTLYLASGEYHLDGLHTYDVGIQSRDNSYGKVIAVDLATGEDRIVSMGHRNMQGVALDGEGRLWVTEHGVRGGDELNLVEGGGNYGWPIESLGTFYSGQPLPLPGPRGRHDRYRAPVFAWLPSAGVSSLATIEGFDESWDGDLLAGSLSSAEFGQSLFHIRTRDERVVFVERIRLGERVRDVQQIDDTRIALWLDLSRLVVLTAERRPDPLGRTREAVMARYDDALGEKVVAALAGCNQCHAFEEGVQMAGPTLNGVLGRNIASTSYAGYSEALRRTPGVWDEESLKNYLRNPEGFAPGTAMPAPGLSEGEVLDALVWALGQADTVNRPHLTYD